MNGIQQYQQTSLESELENADPHRVIQMLMEGALSRMAQAKYAIMQRNYADKAKFIGKAMDIINGLKNSLNMEEGGKLSFDLEGLYVYMIERLLKASQTNSLEIIDEVCKLLGNIKSAWDQIPQSVRDEYATEMQSQTVISEE